METNTQPIEDPHITLTGYPFDSSNHNIQYCPINQSEGNILEQEQEDYPKNFEEFIIRFATEQACYDYIASLRWPKGFRCPRCQSTKAWRTKRALMCCSDCGRQTSITAGTLFQSTRKPLRLWFHVMWWIMSQKTGASAKNLQHTMGFRRYETAWTWLHKFRRVMIRPGRVRLQGTVEVDETYIGGEEEGSKGRKIEKKALIVIAVEVEEKRFGRIRFRQIPDASADSLVPFVKDSVKPGSVIITDGWKGYMVSNISDEWFLQNPI